MKQLEVIKSKKAKNDE